ncbi:MAG TPA: hypothetical protein DCS07_17720 [Bdellovibrionales bacterium]|nr:MAG: hypothetical protein A2Z97_02585 [Bdellovibrionales bacterium GWB1_52_6]OFZ03492.1 MAG: hypothetical protein A2X97_05970 [Bdellovibrionales bacterium GWA1_52_35]OFZ37954.1 MAG: hypothetical protein A2070_11395 [Bdellovibrionales bacterium GWC1_52_8]HAR44441.1 hypothetical protein [Bdellovibrionales bacterium]HCM41076.1 hypothetical protein [Bdellovibrionales bacterium]
MKKKHVSETAIEQTLKMLSQAKEFIKLPKGTKEFSTEKLVSALKSLGLATQDELNDLKARVEKLEAAAASEDSADTTEQTTTSA